MQTETFVLPSEGFLRIKQVLTVIPVGERTWYRGMKKGIFPKPKRILSNINLWDVEDIRNLINQLKQTTAAA